MLFTMRQGVTAIEALGAFRIARFAKPALRRPDARRPIANAGYDVAAMQQLLDDAYRNNLY